MEALDEDNKMANPVNGQGKDGRKEGRKGGGRERGENNGNVRGHGVDSVIEKKQHPSNAFS